MLIDTDFRELAEGGPFARRRLESTLEQIMEKSWTLSELLSAAYFSHVPARVS
jgi:hypothetical protein